jgi:hypothetical protein
VAVRPSRNVSVRDMDVGGLDDGALDAIGGDGASVAAVTAG